MSYTSSEQIDNSHSHEDNAEESKETTDTCSIQSSEAYLQDLSDPKTETLAPQQEQTVCFLAPQGTHYFGIQSITSTPIALESETTQSIVELKEDAPSTETKPDVQEPKEKPRTPTTITRTSKPSRIANRVPTSTTAVKKQFVKHARPIKPPSASAIPVKVPPASKQESKVSIKPSKCSLTKSYKIRGGIVNKHTLEVQFLNKNKRLVQYKQELADKQRPILDLYHNLVEIKKQLSEFGKEVEIEEVKLVQCATTSPGPTGTTKGASGEASAPISQEAITQMKTSIETIPKALTEVCCNLLNRRAALVDLLETVSMSEVDSNEFSSKITALKDEGNELKKSLEQLIEQSELKIKEMVETWQTLVESKEALAAQASSDKLLEVEGKLKLKDAQLLESKQNLHELQRKLEERKQSADKSISDFETTLKEHLEKIKKLEHELEVEKRSSQDVKTRSNNHASTIKSLRNRLTDAESKYKEVDLKNSDLAKKLKSAQDQLKSREAQLTKEKDDLLKSMKDKDKLVVKLRDEKTAVQTRLSETEAGRKNLGKKLEDTVENLRKELEDAKKQLEEANAQKLEVERLNKNMELEFEKQGQESIFAMETITSQINWGKDMSPAQLQTELYSELLSTKVLLRECEEKLKTLEKENLQHVEEKKEMSNRINELVLNPEMGRQEEMISKYKKLLEESEANLKEKSVEVAKLIAETRHLKIRQDALEEQNKNCPTEELKQMVAEGRTKLNQIMTKSMENEQKLATYESTIEKQAKQMNEMENLLRVRDGLIGMIKAKKDELVMEKDSLTRYCKDVRNMLAETREELHGKSDQIQDLREQLEKRETQCTILEKKVHDLEDSLMHTNEKRFKLQDTIGSMEKELQSTKAHVNHINDLQTRYDDNTTSGMLQPIETAVMFHQNQFNISVPLKKIDMIRRKLSELSSMPVPGCKKRAQSQRNSSVNIVHSTKSLQINSGKTYDRMIAMEAKRYEILQKQTDESYDNLSYLLKLTMSKEGNEGSEKNVELSHNEPNISYNNEAHFFNNSNPYNLNNSLHNLSENNVNVTEENYSCS